MQTQTLTRQNIIASSSPLDNNKNLTGKQKQPHHEQIVHKEQEAKSKTKTNLGLKQENKQYD